MFKYVNDICNMILSVFKNDTNNINHIVLWLIIAAIFMAIVLGFLYFRQVKIESDEGE